MTAAQLYLALLGRGLRLRLDDDDRLIVAPGNLLTPRDRVEIKRHHDELAAMVAIDGAQDDEVDDADDEPADLPPVVPPRTHAVPSGCLGPTACAAVGICGRPSGMAEAERVTIEVAAPNARAARNPHRVTRLAPDDISATTPAEEVPDAA
jgi:hypothetical protein